MERLSASEMAEIGAVAGQLVNLSLADVLAVLSNAAGYIGNDSGITHLAATMGVKTIAIFGPTDPAVYGPIGPAVTILQSGEQDFARKPSVGLQQELLNFFRC